MEYVYSNSRPACYATVAKTEPIYRIEQMIVIVCWQQRRSIHFDVISTRMHQTRSNAYSLRCVHHTHPSTNFTPE